MKLVLLLIPCLLSAGVKSIIMDQTYSASVTAPTAAPYTSGRAERVEFRISNFAASLNPANDSSVVTFRTVSGWHMWFKIIAGTSSLSLQSSIDGGSIDCRVDLTGRTDVRVRGQRDIANSRYLIELWNADYSGYLVNPTPCPMTPSADTREGPVLLGNDPNAQNKFIGRIAWIRWFSTVLPAASNGPAEATGGGDLGAWEFEDNINDSSANALNMSVTQGSRSTPYPTTQIYPPQCNAGAVQTKSLGAVATLDGSGSFPVDGGTTLTYVWSQSTGPNTASISSTTAISPTISGLISTLTGGVSYTMQLVVTDGSAQSSSPCFTKVGIVPTNSTGVVQVSGSYFDILGPVTIYGNSPWPWYDVTVKAVADSIGPYFATTIPATVHVTTANPYVPLGSPLAGTVAIASNGASVTGTGTTFTAQWGGAGSTGTILIWTNPTMETAGSGRTALTLTVIDDTHLTITAAFFDGGYYGQTGLSWSKFDTSDTNLVRWLFSGNPTNNWNYYDAVLALYRLWVRTGVDTYLTYARTLADSWWMFAIDHGHYTSVPRGASMHGMMARALDGRPEMWPGILLYLDNWTNNGSYFNPLVDAREAAYMLRFDALVAQHYPLGGGTQATYCGYVSNLITTQWNPQKTTNGNGSIYWNQDLFKYNTTYPYKAPGSVPFQGGIVMTGLQYAHKALAGRCANSTNAATTLTLLKNAALFFPTYNIPGTYPGTTNRGLFYAIIYQSNGDRPIAGDSTVDVVQGTTTINCHDSNCHFQTQFACNNTDFIAPWTANAVEDIVYKVVSCASQNQLTVTPAIVEASINNAQYWKAWAMPTSCGTSLAATCADIGVGTGVVPYGHSHSPALGDRNLLGDTKGFMGYLYNLTKDATYLGYGDEFAGADYGGPATGPGTSGSPSGPKSDGGYGALTTPLLPCQQSPPPCDSLNGQGPLTGMGKYLGQAAGAGDMDNYLGYRAGSQTGGTIFTNLPVLRNVIVQ